MPPTRRSRILRTVCNVCIYIAVIAFFIVINKAIEPTFRGFFCDDQTIAYPYRADTVRVWHLGVGALLGVPVALIAVELIERSRPTRVVSPSSATAHQSATSGQQQVVFLTGPSTAPGGGTKTITSVGSSLGYVFGMYLFGVAATLLVIEVGKLTIGRLRPHFFAVCRPDFAALNCTSGYVENYHCAFDANPAMVKEARKSFPSGHAALAVFTAVFLAVYFRKRLNTIDNALIIRLFVDIILFSLASFTSLSRVIDNKHHWSDVLAGAAIGFIGAVWTVLSMPRHDTWHDDIVRPIRTQALDVEQPINTDSFSYRDSDTWKM